MSSGTWTDKVSALTLVVQESPLHTLKPLEHLIGLAGKRSRDQALMALGAVKDLFGQGDVLPPNRKLRFFSKQPGLLAALQDLKSSYVPHETLPNGLTPQHLMYWEYEDRLKTLYFELLKLLETWCNDEVEFARTKAVTSVFELLRDKPEQEENLLRLLVNKLGDTSKKVASRASYLLLQLQNTHPSMKRTIVDAVESDILLRPGQSSHAKYYAVITLNQTVLQTSDPETANKLLDVYFSLFIAILNRQKKIREGPAEKDLKSSLGNDSKRKLAKAEAEAALERADEELQEKITAQVLTGINRAFPFSKKDSGAFEKHLDTMFRITHSSNFNTSIQALLLIQQISSTHHISTDRFMRTLYQSLLDPRLQTSSKQTMYLNLLYRSLKSDVSVRRVKAFVKRLLQTLSLHDAPFICAALYLIIELRSLFPGLKSMLDTPELDTSPLDDSEAEEGVATDLPAPDDKRSSMLQSSIYDGRKRDPEYSNAEKTCLWELTPWLNHHHPSVTLFAKHLLSTASATPTPTPPKPDPASHTLTHFLDRLAYRNPKTKETSSLRGQSLMQPGLASSNAADTLLTGSKRASDQAGARLNTEAFWQRRAEDVREDEVFFHRYFSMANAGRPGKADKTPSKARAAASADDLDVDDDAVDPDEGFDEDEVWKAIVGSKGGEDVDGDLEDEFDDDDDEEVEGYEDSDKEVELDADASDVEVASEASDAGVELGDGLEDLQGLIRGEDEGEADEVGGLDEDDEDEAPLNLDDESDGLFSSEDEEEEDPKLKKGGNKRKEMTADEVKQLMEERRRGELEGKRTKRRRLNLPTFASADDYAALLGDDGDEDEDGAL